MTPTPEKAKPGRPAKKLAASTNANASVAMAKAKALIFKACGVRPVGPTYSTMPHLPSGSTIVNLLIGGSPAKDGKGCVCPGYPRRHYTEIYGPESCLDADTFVQYEIRHTDGKRANHKGGTIERLWERFHGKSASGDGRGKYPRAKTANAEFWAPAINEEGRIFQNRIVDVVLTGEKECFEIVTLCGEKIVATAEHKFFTGETFVPLSDLKPGDIVLVHNSTPFTVDAVDRANDSDRIHLYVKHHPVAGEKLIRVSSGTYLYKRLLRSRAAIEAQMNGLALEAYIERLNQGTLDGLTFLAREDHVHHLDENVLNDQPDNLVVVSASAHGKLHAVERHNNLRFMGVPATISSITPVGIRKTFDIRMLSPFNNYVANKFVVHNSGKTTLALSAVVECQRSGGVAMFIDFEHSLHHGYAKTIGVDFSEDKFLFYQPDTFEEGIKMLYLGIRSGIDLIVIDSIAAMVPRAELEKDIGDPARIGALASAMSGLLPKLVIWLSNPAGMGKKTKKDDSDSEEETPAEKGPKGPAHPGTALIFINQMRALISSGYGHGGPTEHTPGGKALKFYAHVRLNLHRKKTEVLNKKDPMTGRDKKIPFGNLVEVKVDKTKCDGRQGFTGEIFIRYGYGLDDYLSLIEAGVARRLIGKASAKSGMTFEGENFRGRDALRKYLMEHPEKVELLKTKIYASILENVQPVAEADDDDEVLSDMRAITDDDDDSEVSANPEANEEVEAEEG